ncbi:hypothetical protein QPM05_15380 [Caldibacillus thermoamylovorans]|nr:hypothetical protein [Caldibacillus thermoamylovorans]
MTRLLFGTRKTKRLEEIKGLYSDVLLDEIKQLILKGMEEQK